MKLSSIALGILLGGSTLSPVWADTLIHAGTLIDGVTSKPLQKMTIVIDGNRIKSVEKGYKSATKNDTVVDLRNATVMPGLMDMHTHITFQTSRTSYGEHFTLNPADNALRGVKYARLTLDAGFTTVRDVGDRDNTSIALRNAINQEIIDGPRIYTAALPIATTGGHADPTNGRRFDLTGDPGPKEGVINGADEARKAVRQRYKDGADLIKITATGGVLSVAKNGQNPQFTDDELAAIVEIAKDYGMTVAVHAHGTEGIVRSVKAGVTSIEHGTYMDDEVFDLMKEHGTYYVPTISAGRSVAERSAIPGYFPEVVRSKAATIGPLIQQTFAKAYQSGVKIAFGTDAGVFDHGENGKEFGYMVEVGMPPMEAIQSATIVAAQMLRIDDQLGSIEAGKLADIVAVPGDPLDDISLMEKINFVMKDGKIFKQN